MFKTGELPARLRSTSSGSSCQFNAKNVPNRTATFRSATSSPSLISSEPLSAMPSPRSSDAANQPMPDATIFLPPSSPNGSDRPRSMSVSLPIDETTRLLLEKLLLAEWPPAPVEDTREVVWTSDSIDMMFEVAVNHGSEMAATLFDPAIEPVVDMPSSVESISSPLIDLALPQL
ncbi:uncharacterized protein MONBRDRAFT_38465 [Monosiga brevicollis MX1]|uniref:Uncharacterized protein n=1 Tax=Monosiga brevicollis TaxID=81824 RepID=A9V7Z2_MONBE|nr:uncharacterized protein MONBRDRAFT_38465 [Monosiga brevicollis MX1]EDQ86459.1 predicted protein [Monosiga brevicollis MX1]|eukprot:XP_001748849.1 hypothetical protein [Monosiga brevicollis MX1]